MAARGPARSRRIADMVQRELANIVREELQDPRIRRITFTEVNVSPDLAHANVFYTLLGSDVDLEQCQQALLRASGFLRAELSHRVLLRHAPQLHFVYDASVERGVRLVNLIDRANADLPADAAAPSDGEPSSGD